MPLAKKSYSNSQELRDFIVEAIYDKKGNDIVSLKFTPEITDICDYFVICDVENPIHARSISDNVELKVKEKYGILPEHIEGYENGEWILLDFIDVVVHIFTKEKREFYALENLWADAEFQKFYQNQNNLLNT